MADKRITDLISQTDISLTDVIHNVDVSDTTDFTAGTSKKTTWQSIKDLFMGAGNYALTVFQRYHGDGLVNDEETPVDSSCMKLKINANDYVALYNYSYGLSLTYRQSAYGIFEIHGYDNSLGWHSAIVTFRHIDGNAITYFRNGNDSGSLKITGTGSSASFDLETENGNGDLRITPHGTGVTQIKSPVFVPLASAVPGTNGYLTVEATSNTSLTFRLKGSDGTVRSAALTLS
jgi:hypothetical protein